MKKTTALLTALLLTAAFTATSFASEADAPRAAENANDSPQLESALSEIDFAEPDETAELSESSLNPNKMSKTISTNRWAQTSTAFLYENDEETFCVVDSQKTAGSITVDTYRKSDFQCIRTQTVPMELSLFGGFYAGETCNYMVFGQKNLTEENSKEVFRVVKYDKSFQRISAASITGGTCFTCLPFNYGSLRMAESGNELIIRTSRLCYKKEDDGKRHQSQLTIVLDTDKMRVKNDDLGRYQGNHVSHSFNQFVLYDNGSHVTLDHGDAYPRSICMQISEPNSTDYKKIELLEIPGDTGANCTGVTVGGFDSSPTHYLVAYNSIDHSKVTSYTSFEMKGLTKDERDVIILTYEKASGAIASQKLTNYVDRNLLGSTPYLVKTAEDRFLLLWEEFKYSSSSKTIDQGVRYVELDGTGKPLTEVMSMEEATLSADCQPIFMNGEVVWYLNSGSDRRFYRIRVGEVNIWLPSPASSVVKLTDPAKTLGSDSVICAAAYNEQGEMTEALFGTRSGNTIRFQKEITEDWTLFFLDSHYVPLLPSMKPPVLQKLD